MSALTIVALVLAVIVYIGGVIFHTVMVRDRSVKLSRGQWMFAIFWPIGEAIIYFFTAVLTPFGFNLQEEKVEQAG
jgi:uncharacterized membrane protein